METWVKEIWDFAVAEMRRQKEAAKLEREASLPEENDDLPKSIAGQGSVTAKPRQIASKEEPYYASLQEAYFKSGYL